MNYTRAPTSWPRAPRCCLSELGWVPLPWPIPCSQGPMNGRKQPLQEGEEAHLSLNGMGQQDPGAHSISELGEDKCPDSQA